MLHVEQGLPSGRELCMRSLRAMNSCLGVRPVRFAEPSSLQTVRSDDFAQRRALELGTNTVSSRIQAQIDGGIARDARIGVLPLRASSANYAAFFPPVG